MQARHHSGGRVGWGHQAPPSVHFKTFQRFGHGRNVGQGAAALYRGDGQCFELACLDVGRGCGQVVEVEIDLTGQQSQLSRVAPVLRDVNRKNACIALEHFGGQMTCTAIAT